LVRWYLLGLAISLLLCLGLAAVLVLVGHMALRPSLVLVLSSAVFLLLVVAAVFTIQKAGVPRGEALERFPEEDRLYYADMGRKLSTAIWAIVLVALSLFALAVVAILA